MHTPRAIRLPVGFWLPCWLLAILAFGTLLTIGVAHLGYPGFTETMEGDILQHIERAARGEPIYAAPSATFIPLTYMPLYDYAAAPLYRVFGDSFFGPRLLSLLATLGSVFWVGRIALRESGSATAAALAVGVFCGSFRVMDAALFTVHPDGLLLFLLLGGYWFWAHGTTRLHDLLWLACFTLAFWTKQHGALFFFWAACYAMLFRANALPRWAILAGLVLGGPVSYFTLGNFLGERFWFHTLVEPTHWEQSWWLSLRRTAYVLCVLAPVSFVVFLEFGREQRQRLGWRPSPLFWFAATSLVTSIFTMRISGASNNHYAPLHALLSVAFARVAYRVGSGGEPAGVGRLLLLMAVAGAGVVAVALRNFPGHAIPVWVPGVALAAGLALVLFRWRRPEPRGVWEALILLAAQCGVMLYDPREFLPRADFDEAIQALRAELGGLDGPVIWVDYGGIPADLTGRKLRPAPSWVALEDVERQQIDARDIEADLHPWSEMVEREENLYLLSFDRLERVTVWKRFAPQFELLRDYGGTFAGVRQIADHWYGSGDAPRYLYRRKR